MTQAGKPETLLHLRGLSKQYVQRQWFSRKKFVIQAIHDVELMIRSGSTFALVGESGAGKSTLARCLAALEEPSSGEIWFEGKDLLALSKEELFSVRPRIQLVFQNAAVALNPRFSSVEIVSEPLVIQRRGTLQERRRRALELMEQVGLSSHLGNRLPLELSGGQRQRLAIARALALEPKLLILDEPVSGLDLSIQAQIVNLLLELQAMRSLTYVFITHDLSLVSRIADEVVIMRQGRFVEQGTTFDLLARPQHPYTRKLLASVPRLETRACGTCHR